MPNQPLTESEIEFVRENYGKMKRQEIADKLGKHLCQIKKALKKLGLKRDDYWSDADLKFLDDNPDMSIPEIAKILKRSISAISAARGKRNIKMTKREIKIGTVVNGWKILDVKSEPYGNTGKRRRIVFVENTTNGKLRQFSTYELFHDKIPLAKDDTFEDGRGKKHGMSSYRIYKIFSKMKDRCNNEKCRSYPRYGGRGIKICDEWLNDFSKFYEWSIQNEYADNLSIDRIDNDGNYCPENCRWVPQRIQANNTSTNTYFTAFGETKSLSDWHRDHRCMCTYTILQQRITSRKWNPELALITPKTTKEKSPLTHIVGFLEKHHPDVIQEYINSL